MSRYQWNKPSDLPERFELVDQVTNLPIGVILDQGRRIGSAKRACCWHGAPSAEGMCGRLSDAKEELIDGLPS